LDNKIRDAMGSVRAEEALIRSTKAFLASKASAPAKPFSLRYAAVAFACLAFMVLGFGGWNFYMVPVSAISVDVNPSIELGVNRLDRVVSVKGYNEDGKALAASVELKNLNYSDALDVLLSSETMQPYRANDGLVSITVIGNTEQKSEEMRARIAACGYAAAPNVECRCGNREEVEIAHASGLSFGKYRAYLELQALDPSVTPEDVQGLTMRQIRDKIQELGGSGNAQYGQGSGGQRNGNGAGNGRGGGGKPHRGRNKP
jgi:hypothetical protein